MAVSTITIDGRTVPAREGQTIFEVARAAGIAIPTLCHLEGLSEVGSCRVCAVAIEGSPHRQPACATKVSEKMVVQTDTEALREDRRMIVELLFAERNHICAVCVADGDCELQNLAIEVGMDHVRLGYLNPALEVDLSHERYGLDHNRCVLCMRCVRTCDEIEGAHTWGVAERGTGSRIVADVGQPWGESPTCTSCGKCVMSCPTGALFERGDSVAERKHGRSRLEAFIEARGKES